MSTRLSGASLAFEAARIDVQLPKLLSQFAAPNVDDDGAALQVPSIAVPEVSDDDIPLDALGELALKEILSHARSGTARVCLPLLPATFKKGPFSFTLPDNAEVIVDLVVEEGHIIKDATKGRIEPPLQLPLGVQVKGVYLDEDGSLIAALSGFVDLNLSFLALSGLKVPPTLREVLEQALGQEDTRLYKSAAKATDGEASPDAAPQTPSTEGLPDDEEEGEGVSPSTTTSAEAGTTDAGRDDAQVVGAPETDLDAFARAKAIAEEDDSTVDSGGDVDEGPDRKGEADVETSGDKSEDEEGKDAPPIDLQRLSVEARDVLAHLTPLTLGNAGRLVPGEGTRFDVDFTLQRIRVHGAIELEDGEVTAGGFHASGLQGKGVVDWVLHDVTDPKGMSLDFKCERGAFKRARVELKNGSHVELEDVSIVNSHIHVDWSQQDRDDSTDDNIDEGVDAKGGPATHSVAFDVTSGDAQGRLVRGELHAGVGGQDLVAVLSPCSARGSLRVKHDSRHPQASHHHVDIEVEDGGARIERLHAPLGVATFDLQHLQASGRGRFRAATDMGFAFSGVVGVEGEVFDGTLELGPVHAHLVEGSRAQFTLRDVAASDAGLEALVAHGQLDVRLASGTLPLSDAVALRFSRGAAGRVVFDEVTYLPDAGVWPVLRGSGSMMARADPVELEGLLTIPSGSAHIQLGAFSLSPTGDLALERFRTWLSSDDVVDDDPT